MQQVQRRFLTLAPGLAVLLRVNADRLYTLAVVVACLLGAGGITSLLLY